MSRLWEAFWSRFSAAYASLLDERNDLRRWQAEYADTLQSLYKNQQAWKARAMAAEVRLAQAMRARHPSGRTVMPDEQIREFDEWLASLPTTEEE